MKAKDFLTTVVCIFVAAAISFADDFKNLIGEGNRLHDEGQYDAAIAKYREAEKLDPKSALVNYEIGFTYYTMRDLKKALPYLKKAEKLNKNARLVDAICNGLGSVYDDLKMPDSALATYRKGAKSNPNSYLIPFNAAITFLNMEKLDSAKVWIEKAVNNTKRHEGSYYIATIISQDRGDWLDLYSYGMYALLINKKSENKNILYTMLYRRAKNLITRDGEKVVVNINHSPSQKNGMHEAFLMTLGISLASDSSSHKDYTQVDSTRGKQMEFLTHIFTESIKLIADMKAYNNPLKSLYEGLVKNGFAEAFAYAICREIDRPTYAKWVIKNRETEKKMYDWLNEDYANSK